MTTTATGSCRRTNQAGWPQGLYFDTLQAALPFSQALTRSTSRDYTTSEQTRFGEHGIWTGRRQRSNNYHYHEDCYGIAANGKTCTPQGKTRRVRSNSQLWSIRHYEQRPRAYIVIKLT